MKIRRSFNASAITLLIEKHLLRKSKPQINMSGLLKRFLKIMNQCQSILENICVGDLLANVIRTTKYVNISYSWRKSYIFSTPQNILYVILMDFKVDKSISIRYYNAGDHPQLSPPL